MKQILFVDLDGVLINTAHSSFKPMKDGLEETDLSKIPLIKGAKEFIANQIEKGNRPVILSDSHPKYVDKIAKEIFKIESVSLTDKPNTQKTIAFISNDKELKEQFSNKDNFLLIGDSWLDVELGRRLNVRTVLTSFYVPTEIEERDGIGQDWKPIKTGPTYYAKNFSEVENVIDNPLDNLLALESVFQNGNSIKSVHFRNYRNENGFIAFRCLARQNNGECDKYARADMYHQIDNPNRSKGLLEKLAQSAENYIKQVLSTPKFNNWDYLTYLTDKSTTTPPNKMKEIFDLVNVAIPKIQLFKWNDTIEGSLRNKPDYNSRREFIRTNFFLKDDVDVKNKNIIILDDQFTTSATAYYVSNLLRDNGAKNILFIALFYLTTEVKSELYCPTCGKQLVIKINRKNGKRFYSCLPPRFGGEGCGYIHNID